MNPVLRLKRGSVPMTTFEAITAAIAALPPEQEAKVRA